MRLRFTDTTKWHNSKYYEMDPHCKLMYEFLLDLADVGGFITDMPGMKQLTDVFRPWPEDEILRCLEVMKDSFVMIYDGQTLPKYLWSIKYCSRQRNLPLNPANPSHRGILKRHKEFSHLFMNEQLYQEFYFTHIKPKLEEINDYKAKRNTDQKTGGKAIRRV